MQLSVCQEKALIEFDAFMSSEEKEFILSGFTGVGKTFITEKFIAILDKRNKFLSEILNLPPYKLVLTATTNKAVRVLKNIVDKMDIDVEVKTIHSFLRLRIQKDFKSGRENLVKTQETTVHNNTIVFIDEASYSDSILLKIVRECFMYSKVVWIGDRDQLLSVGYNTSPVFDSPLIKSKVHMVTPQRNQGTINKLAHAYRNVLHGDPFPIIKESDEIVFLSGKEFKTKIEETFTSTDYFSNPDYAKILGWTNSKVTAYNQFIRQLYTNTEPYVINEYVTSNSVVMRGMDQVILSSDTTLKIKDVSDVHHDNYGIAYQDLSFYNYDEILRVPLDFKEFNSVLKSLYKVKDFHSYFNLKENYADMRPSHASTIHKAQGSTYNNVFMDLYDIGANNKPMEVARLLYVGTSRPKNKLYLYGQLPEKYSGI